MPSRRARNLAPHRTLLFRLFRASPSLLSFRARNPEFFKTAAIAKGEESSVAQDFALPYIQCVAGSFGALQFRQTDSTIHRLAPQDDKMEAMSPSSYTVLPVVFPSPQPRIVTIPMQSQRARNLAPHRTLLFRLFRASPSLLSFRARNPEFFKTAAIAKGEESSVAQDFALPYIQCVAGSFGALQFRQTDSTIHRLAPQDDKMEAMSPSSYTVLPVVFPSPQPRIVTIPMQSQRARNLAPHRTLLFRLFRASPSLLSFRARNPVSQQS